MYLSTPDYYNDYLCHYGVKGMKWKNHIYAKGKGLLARLKRRIGIYRKQGAMTGDSRYKRLTNGMSSRDSRFKRMGNGMGNDLRFKEAPRYRTSGNISSRGYASSKNPGSQPKLNRTSATKGDSRYKRTASAMTGDSRYKAPSGNVSSRGYSDSKNSGSQPRKQGLVAASYKAKTKKKNKGARMVGGR